MNQKYLKWIRIGVVVLLAAYFYISQYLGKQENKSEPIAQKQEQTRSSKPVESAVKKSQVSQNYDTIMRDDAIGQNKNASVDYYMLALSWSPTFCESQERKYGDNLPASAEMQCGMQRQYGWVIHGLWPQSANARGAAGHPRFCQGDLPQLDYSVIEKYLAESPSPNLLQGEWEKHGACAFSSADAYFQKQQELYRTLHLPTEELNRKELFRWMKKNNPHLNNAYMGASRGELFICYDLNWNVMDCPSR